MNRSVYVILALIVHFDLKTQVHSANILSVIIGPSPSHFMWNEVLVNALADQGHNITVLAIKSAKKAPKNVHYIVLEGADDRINARTDKYSENLDDVASTNSFKSVYVAVAVRYMFCADAVISENLKTLLNYPENFKFDLILYEFSFGSCLFGLLHRFNYPPLIGVSPYNNPYYSTDLIGSHVHPSYIPYPATSYSFMNFFQRAHNFLLYFIHFIGRLLVSVEIDKISKGIFGPGCPHVRDLEKMTDLVLINTHPAVDFAEPLHPSEIPVGGMQIKDPQPLSEKMNNFVEAAEKGIVLFSLGTNVMSFKLDFKKIQEIVKVFELFPQYNFIWKFENDKLPMDLPQNVLAAPWIPQNDVLAHPKTKAFITHGGALSINEAIWYGVPMVGIPFYGDQNRNVQKCVSIGVGEYIYFSTLTSTELKGKLWKVLNDPSFQENSKIRSRAFRDQPEKPIDRAVWWVEYVLRNPDPVHLRSPVLDLGYFAGNGFDVLTAFFFIIFGIFSASCLCIIKVFKRLKSSKIKIKKS